MLSSAPSRGYCPTQLRLRQRVAETLNREGSRASTDVAGRFSEGGPLRPPADVHPRKSNPGLRTSCPRAPRCGRRAIGRFAATERNRRGTDATCGRIPRRAAALQRADQGCGRTLCVRRPRRCLRRSNPTQIDVESTRARATPAGVRQSPRLRLAPGPLGSVPKRDDRADYIFANGRRELRQCR
jgi:hypothetical protein